MEILLGYGNGTQTVDIADDMIMDILKTNSINVSLTGPDEVSRSLKNPIGTNRLKDIVNPSEKVVIITSDITRPVPSYEIIPSVLEELYLGGVKKEDITIVFALGSHRKHTEKEMINLVGEKIYNEIKCIDSDINDCISLGVTSSGTPVDIFSVVANADRRICLANIEYHYFAGYSGGAKAIMPGCSTPEAIQANHSKMILPDSKAGKVNGNPVRDDLEEGIKFCPIDFIVNVVLDENKRIIYSVAGHYIDAHRIGCEFLDKIYKKEIDEKADIVIVSQAGAPKDINLYQTQKALDNAKHAIKDGGVIVLVGACNEGFGSNIFEEWMRNAETPDELISKIEENFVLGGHKAAAIALVLKKAQIFFVSEMNPKIVESIFMRPFKSLQEAFDEALKVTGEDSKVLVMPYGGSTLPVIKD